MQAASQGAGHTRLVNSGRGGCECQAVGSFAPAPAPYKVVPLGDEVVKWASARAGVPKGVPRLAEGNAAHHATACLAPPLILAKLAIELVKVVHALCNGPQLVCLAAVG